MCACCLRESQLLLSFGANICAVCMRAFLLLIVDRCCCCRHHRCCLLLCQLSVFCKNVKLWKRKEWGWELSEIEAIAHALIPMWHFRVRYDVGDVNTVVIVVVKIYECITFKLHTNKQTNEPRMNASATCMWVCVCATLNALIFIVFRLQGFCDTIHTMQTCCAHVKFKM